MTMRGGGWGGGKRPGGLRGRQLALLRRRLAGSTDTVTGGPVVLDPAATTGDGTTTIVLQKLGVLAAATSGAGSTAVALRMLGVLAAATSGRTNLAIVLIELGSLSAITAGQGSTAAALVGIRVLSPATTGVGATQATLAAIRLMPTIGTSGAGTDATLAVAVRPLVAGSSGVSTMGAALTGGSMLLTAATSGSSEMSVELIGDQPPIALIGPIGGGFVRYQPPRTRIERPSRRRAARVLDFAAATHGRSTLDVTLSTTRTPEPPRPLSDPLEEWATIIMLLEAA